MENNLVVMNELALIRKLVESIQEKIDDLTLSGEDVLAIRDARREFANGETISDEDLKKELGI